MAKTSFPSSNKRIQSILVPFLFEKGGDFKLIDAAIGKYTVVLVGPLFPPSMSLYT